MSEGVRESVWLQGMAAGFKHDICIKAYSETDFTENMKKFDVPTLILHGDDDQIVPIGAPRSFRPSWPRIRSRSNRGCRTACARRSRKGEADLLDFIEAKAARASGRAA